MNLKGPKLSPEQQEARTRYNQQKHMAVKKRNIPFEITFEEWYDIWMKSGHWEERGRSGYVMTRYNDIGPYAVGNVEIRHTSENAFDRRGIKYPPRTQEHSLKISIANTGKPNIRKGKKNSPEHIAKYIETRKRNKEMKNEV